MQAQKGQLRRLVIAHKVATEREETGSKVSVLEGFHFEVTQGSINHRQKKAYQNICFRVLHTGGWQSIVPNIWQGLTL